MLLEEIFVVILAEHDQKPRNYEEAQGNVDDGIRP